MRTIAVIPAFNDGSSVGDTVTSLRDAGLSEIVVVDDGSTDQTAAMASAAGATVIRSGRNRGKHAALDRGMAESSSADIFLMVDADTGETAAAAIALIAPVESGEVDMAIGVLPSAGRKGGFGTVKNVAAWFLLKITGQVFDAPLSGQRALRREVFETCRPLARGFAVDAALTADALRNGFKVREMPVAMDHDHTGRSIAGFVHRGRQGIDVVKAMVPRYFGRNAKRFRRPA